jgi:hypothetical protein
VYDGSRRSTVGMSLALGLVASSGRGIMRQIFQPLAKHILVGSLGAVLLPAKAHGEPITAGHMTGTDHLFAIVDIVLAGPNFSLGASASALGGVGDRPTASCRSAFRAPRLTSTRGSLAKTGFAVDGPEALLAVEFRAHGPAFHLPLTRAKWSAGGE